MTDVTCYVLAGKAKSEMMCRAFAAGVRAAGGVAALCTDPVNRLLPGAAVFYGVRPHQAPLLEQAKAEGRDWYYIDNAYFDATRERYFRITKNRLQHNGQGASDGKRFAALGIGREDWRSNNGHILLCPQSDEFLDLFCPHGKHWAGVTNAVLRSYTAREIRERPWNPDKLNWYRTLPDDLVNCKALVTFSSASAITAMLHGVPAFVTAADCIARPVANTDLSQIERPVYTDGAALDRWLAVVADHQFTVAEIENGYAWRRLQDVDCGL